MRANRLLPLAIVALALAATGFVFADTLIAMAQVWRNSVSYEHGPLIPLAALWLIWRRRADLAAIPVRPWWPAVVPLALGGIAWMLGRLAGVNALEQFAVVGMVPVIVALVLGWRVAWALAFPLLFLLFAVPFGTFMLPTLMDWTADFTVAAIRLTGIPVLREGTSFALPTGRWSVVESCSGIRYLLAAVPLACLYSYVSYHSYRARALFVALTVAVALVGNWVRAYVIVMLGHVSGMKVAVGADHLVYGWLFFGIVMALTFWLGAFIPDRAAAERATGSGGDAGAAGGTSAAASAGAALAASGKLSSSAAVTVAALAAVAISAAWPVASEQLRARSPSTVDLSKLAAGFDALPAPSDPSREYRPHYQGDASRFAGVSRTDPLVAITVFHYVRQHADAEMIREGNRPMPGKIDDSAWQIRARRTVPPAAYGADFPGAHVNEYLVAGPDGLHLVWEWFEVGGKATASPARAKLQTALSVLSGKGDESLAWYLWTAVRDPRDLRDGGELARTRLAEQAWRVGRVAIRPAQ